MVVDKLGVCFGGWASYNKRMADKFGELEKQLKALANKRRLRILTFITKRKQATVGEIADELGISMQATSKHLRLLYHVDMVESEQTGLQVRYHLAKIAPPIASLL